jgi:hypothetical protein
MYIEVGVGARWIFCIHFFIFAHFARQREARGEKRREGPVMSPAHWGTSLRVSSFFSLLDLRIFADICFNCNWTRDSYSFLEGPHTALPIVVVAFPRSEATANADHLEFHLAAAICARQQLHCHLLRSFRLRFFN